MTMLVLEAADGGQVCVDSEDVGTAQPCCQHSHEGRGCLVLTMKSTWDAASVGPHGDGAPEGKELHVVISAEDLAARINRG